MSIRSRLLLTVLSVLLPALAAALWLIAHAAQERRVADERTLVSTTRALAFVTDREPNQDPGAAQSFITRQRLPPGWTATVIDNRGTVTARHPGGSGSVGSAVPADLESRLTVRGESLFHAASPAGEPVTGFSSTSPQGWISVVTMPGVASTGSLPGAWWTALLAAAALLGIALTATAWQARRISAPLRALTADVARMQLGEVLAPRHTGLVDCDRLARALSDAADAMRRSEASLARQVTEAAERRREAEQRGAESQRVEALGRLTGGVAHDFNNLLGVVSNSAHLMRRMSADSGLEEPLAATLRAVDSGSRLVEQLLRFAGRQPLHPQWLDLREYLPDIQVLMKAVLGQRVTITVGIAPGTWPVRVDVSELELALVNLSLNARDALPSGGNLWLQARNADPAEFQDLAPGDYVLLTITDDGRGLDETLAERVFEPFFTTKVVGQGTGLGLSQVHGFSVQAGGTARFASTPGLGSTVTLVLPGLRRPQSGSGASTTLAAPAPGRRLAGVRVLLVEDNEELAQVTAALMRTEGLVVQHARDAQQALLLIGSNEAFDVVLSDIVMPGGMDGIALAKILHERTPDLPIVLISAYSAAMAGAGDFTVLRKPCPPGLLRATLERAVGRADVMARG